MKNWAVFGLVALAGYWMYSAWFASDEPTDNEPQKTEQIAAEDPGSIPAAGDGPEGDLHKPARLDLSEERPAEARTEAEAGPSQKLHDARRQAVDKGDAAAARRIADDILRQYPASDAARWIHFERGKAALQVYRELKWKPEGLRKAQEARKELTHALFLRSVGEAERDGLRQILKELADTIMFSSRHVDGADRIFKPRRGDNLSTLCLKTFRAWGARVSPGLVADINGLKSPNQMRAGEPLKVPLGEPRIVVVKSEFRLYFLLDGAYVRDFPVGLGREDSTPETSFTIEKKQRNPDWYPAPGKRIPYGDARNILGTRWLGFRNTAVYSGFGIHGTPDPSSIGKRESSGCVRMLREDVERLYGWTPQGTPVDILP